MPGAPPPARGDGRLRSTATRGQTTTVLEAEGVGWVRPPASDPLCYLGVVAAQLTPAGLEALVAAAVRLWVAEGRACSSRRHPTAWALLTRARHGDT